MERSVQNKISKRRFYYEFYLWTGLPDEIVSDNGVQFKNSKYIEFTDLFSIKNTFSAPGYPATNGQAVSIVKYIK